MNDKDILKSILESVLPELSAEEIEKLNQSSDKKDRTPFESIEVKEEAETPQPPTTDFNKIVNSREDFFYLACNLGEERRHERVFNRVFDKQRDLNTRDGYGWDSTMNWLHKSLYAQPAKSMEFLINAYRTVELMYLRNRANGADQWNDDRFKDFKCWVNIKLEDLLPPTKNRILEELNIDGETKAYFKLKLVDSGLLTLDSLVHYLHLAFVEKRQLKEEEKLSFLFKPQNKITYRIFYDYFVEKGSPYRMQGEYAGLLGGYFKGYKTSTVSSNFARHSY